MASIRQRVDRGGLYYLTYYDPHDNQRYRFSTGTRNRKIAELWLSTAEDMISLAELGRLEKVGKITADDVAGKPRQKAPPIKLSKLIEKDDLYCQSADKSESTLRNNKMAMQHFISVVGDKPACNVTHADVVKWKERAITAKDKPLTRKSCASYHTHLKAKFNRSIKFGWHEPHDMHPFRANPFQVEPKIDTSVPRGDGKDRRPMTREEIASLLALIETDETWPDAWLFAQYIRTLYYSGRRRLEVLPLKRSDIDFEENSVTFLVLKRKTKPRIKFPLHTALKEVLWDIVNKTNPLPDEYIFKSSNVQKKGKSNPHWTPKTVTNRFTHYRNLAGFPGGVVLHSTRHSFATHLGDSGVEGEHLQALLQHTSRAMTEIYDHSENRLLGYKDKLDSLKLDMLEGDQKALASDTNGAQMGSKNE